MNSLESKFEVELSSDNAVIDPGTILMFMQLAKELVDLYRSCQETENKAFSRAKRLRGLDKMVMRRFLRNHKLVGRSKMNQVQNILASVSSKITEEEFEQLWNGQ